MFKNKKFTLTIDKKVPEDGVEPIPGEFEEKVDYVLGQLKGMGAAIFAGICVYVLLDTHRQVKVVQAGKED